MGGWGGGGKDRCVQGVFTNGLAMKDIERRQRAEIYLCERESLRGHALWRRSGREARAEKGYQERARSGSNAHTRSSAGTPRDPLGTLSRTAHRIGETNSNIDEEVDGGVVATRAGRSRSKSVLETEESGCGACGACGGR